MPRSKLDQEFIKIKRDLRSMSKLVQKGLTEAMDALRNRDTKLYSKVIKRDREEIDVLYIKIEERCIHCIALHQPVAGDLRFISTAMGVAANLERIGDYAKDIAMIVPFIENEKPLENVEKILQEMGDITVIMTKNAVHSFINKNKSYVDKVNIDEEKIDTLYGNVFQKLKEKLTISCSSAPLALNLLLVARYLERIGDHAVNISKRTMYVIKGAWKYM